MTPQQETILRQQAKARGYTKAQEDQFVQFAASQPAFASAPSASAQPQPEAQKPGLLQRAGTFLKEQFTGQKKEHGTLGSIVSETVGSKGLLGVAQMPGKVIGQFGLAKDQVGTAENAGTLADQTRELAVRIRNTSDPDEKARLQKLLDENRRAMGLVSESSEDLASREVTPREAIATSVRGASTAFTGSGSAAKNLALKGASKLAPSAPKAAQTITKAATAGRGLLPRAAEQAAINAGFNAAGNIESGRQLNAGAGNAALLGAALPVVGTALGKGARLIGKGSDSYAARVINSLIKPLQKDFAYGSNPGRGVAQEGITFSNLEDGLRKISERRQQLGAEIRQYVRGMTWRFDANDAFEPISKALNEAKKAPRTNSDVIRRLDDVVKDIMQVSEKEGVETAGRKLTDLSAEELFLLKQDIAAMTKFTGNASDDQVVNKALKQAYGKIKEKLNKAEPNLIESNERYGDLASAEIAARYRDKIEQRLNLVGLGSKVTAIGTAMGAVIASGGSAIPAILVGASVAGLEKALGSARVKTRFARWLARSSRADKTALYKKIPGLRNAVERVFGYSDSQ